MTTKTAMATTYKYESLSTERSIRVLRLRAGWKRDPIQCDLSEMSLDSESVQLGEEFCRSRQLVTHYEALSYVWVDKEPPHFMQCGQRQIRVTENCYEAL